MGLFKHILTWILSKISHYSVASTDDAAFFIGGYISSRNYQSAIGQFKDGQWHAFGNRHVLSYSQRSITQGSLTMILGGWVANGDGE